jgi:uncharacterized protein
VSREFPDWINPWAAAQARREFRGTLPLARMERLAPLLADSAGEARFECRLTLDNERRPLVRLRVEAALQLLCQASLTAYEHRVERVTELGVVADESEEKLLPGHLEPVLAPTGRLALIDLVEDELLLAMPRVPRDPSLQPVLQEFGEVADKKHDGTRDGKEREGVPAGDEPTRRPFADLGRLLDQNAARKADRKTD